MFGEKAKRIAELEKSLADSTRTLETAQYVIGEVRKALKVPDGESLVDFVSKLKVSLESSQTLLEGAANVIKSADEWYDGQKTAKKVTKKRKK